MKLDTKAYTRWEKPNRILNENEKDGSVLFGAGARVGVEVGIHKQTHSDEVNKAAEE